VSGSGVPNLGLGDDGDALRRLFLAGQSAAAHAHAHAAILLAEMAGARGVDYSRTPSGGLLRLVRDARRNRCAHWPQGMAKLCSSLPTWVDWSACLLGADWSGAGWLDGRGAVRPMSGTG